MHGVKNPVRLSKYSVHAELETVTVAFAFDAMYAFTAETVVCIVVARVAFVTVAFVIVRSRRGAGAFR